MQNTAKTPIGENGQGCLFSGEFYVNKVPGNFHIATHSVKQKPPKYDFNHEIHDLFFGDEIKGKYPLKLVQSNILATY